MKATLYSFWLLVFALSSLSLKAQIYGNPTVCVGSTTTLTDSTSGGTWSSSNIDVASVDSIGTVIGVSAGNAIISYILPGDVTTLILLTVGDKIISTVAGNGISGSSGDNGQATNAEFSNPFGITVDFLGNVYVADWNNARIQKIDTNGNITTFAGITDSAGYSGDGGPATIAKIFAPAGIAVDGIGNIYFADYGNNVIRKINTSNIITTVAGNGFAGYSGDNIDATASELNGPTALTVDASNNIYIADQFNNRIRKVNSSGTISTIAGNGTTGYSGDGSLATSSELHNPFGIALDGSGNIYFIDGGNNVIRKINSSTNIINTIAGNGTVGFSGDNGPATAASWDGAYDLKVDNAGDIYIADRSNNRVRFINTLNTIYTIIGDGGGYGGDGGNATSAGINAPEGIALDGAANIYVSDAGDNHIRKIQSIATSLSLISGSSSLFAGTTIILSDSTSSGTWSSSNTLIATIGTSGIVNGIAAGTAVISYTVTNSCGITSVLYGLTVDSLGIISGGTTLCVGSTTILSDSTTGGTWSSSNAAVAIVDTTGTVMGVATGTAAISYVIDGIYTTTTIGVLPVIVPAVGMSVSPGTTICSGVPDTFEALPVNGGSLPVYQWYVNGSFVGGSGYSYVYNPSNGDIVTLELTSNAMCADPDTAVTSITMTVIPVPSTSPISGSSTITDGFTTTLSDTATGGSWSSNNAAIATVGSSGIVTGVSAGSAVVSYVVTNTCGTAYATKTVTVYPGAGVITGGNVVCTGQTLALTDAATGGIWSSSNSLKASVGSLSGIVNGVAAGTVTITYTVMSSHATAVVTILASPSAITGGGSICSGYSIALIDATSGGSWSSGNATIAAIDTLGNVTGVSAGTVLLSYTITNGCSATHMETINRSPGAIYGSSNLCTGFAYPFTDTTAGGVWSRSSLAASVDSFTGVVSGTLSGGSIITYTFGSCHAVFPVTVSATPISISVPGAVCTGRTITLSDGTIHGNWSSTNSSTAAIGTSGVLTGIASGTVTISYAVTSGCAATAVITVNANPSIISGSAVLCTGTSYSFTDSIAGGIWRATTPAVTVDSLTGTITGQLNGTSTISYSLNGCFATLGVTVATSPATIYGGNAVCVGQSETNTDATTGGEWSSQNSGIAVVSSTGIATGVSAGLVNISYSVLSGCFAFKTITVNALPAAISGASPLCTGNAYPFADVTIGGTWHSSNAACGSVSTAGVVTGILAGAVVISYTAGGCTATYSSTVAPAPGAITAGNVCAGQSVTCSDGTGGGTWSSANTTIATITSSGVATGVAVGTTTISYVVASGCYSLRNITVNATPAAISGTAPLCAGSSYAFTDITTGGVWSSSNPACGSVSALGLVKAEIAGGVTINYTAGGCTAVYPTTVAPLPAAIAGANICAGTTATFTDATAGGVWSAATTAIATVGSAGYVSGVAAGTTFISYTLSSGCAAVKTVTVFAAPTAISGVPVLCVGASYTFTDATTGGTWSRSTTAAMVGSLTGIVTGSLGGGETISYTLGSCSALYAMTVASQPAAISGTGALCTGFSYTFNDASIGGTWSSSNTAIALTGSTGVVSGIAAGTATISYATGPGCPALKTVMVTNSPGVVSGTNLICPGSTFTFTDATGGGFWSSSALAVSIGSTTGVATGGVAGGAIITYSAGGCNSISTVTVGATPGSVSGPGVCVGQGYGYTTTVSGGDWSSGNTSIATVGSSGIVTGISAGTALISYSTTLPCPATHPVTVNPSPAPVSGYSNICIGSNYNFTDATAGGTWSVSRIVAEIGTSTGLVTGEMTGTAIISYNWMGCPASYNISVSANPASILNGIIGTGYSATFTDATSGGIWSSSNTAVATAGSLSGIIAGITTGTVVISYTLPTGCFTECTVSVLVVPKSIQGPDTICTGYNYSYSDSITGGYWSIDGIAATVNHSTGVCTGLIAGSITLYYALDGFTVSKMLNVGQTPAAITPRRVCSGWSADYFCASNILSWSSSNTAIATVAFTDINDGTVTGVSAGTVVISYTTDMGCPSTSTASIYGSPGPIGGTNLLCSGTTYNFTDDSASGTWSSNNGAVSVGASSGVVTGEVDGATVITYTNATGCAAVYSASVTNGPGIITGPSSVETSLTTTLSDAAGGGAWSSANTAVATTGTTSGDETVVNGVSVGSAIITYALPGGCYKTFSLTVTPFTGRQAASANTAGGPPATGNLRAFPNPSDGTIHLIGLLPAQKNGLVSISVTDVSGQKVYNEFLQVQSGIVDHSVTLSASLPNGIYLLSVGDADNIAVCHITLLR